MNSVARPRGPLPRRVYWTRRMLVLGVLALLVFGVAHLAGGSNPAPRPTSAPIAAPSSGLTPSTTEPAAPVGPSNTATGATSAGTTSAGNRHTKGRKHQSPTPTPTPLAVPTGPCADSDVLVTPAVRRAYAGQDVTITLDLTTQTSPACTWEVSAKTVVVALTSGEDRIWSSQDCPSALGRHSVVVRKDHITKVPLVWGGRRSDNGCSRGSGWAEPGWYHVQAAAYGAGPTDEQFHLLTPPRPTITVTPKPRKKHGSADATPSSPSASPSSSPTATASSTG